MKSPGLFSLNKSIYNGMCAALCALAAVACGDSDQRPEVTTTVASVEGGGVAGGPLADTLTVYAIDADSGLPIAGATVFLGPGQSAHKVGQTGSNGKLVVASLDGAPQMVSLSASGYASASWGLVSSAIATIPLESMASPPPNTQVWLNIPGWSDLPPLTAGNYRIARFAFSRPRGLDALEATLASAGPDCKQSDTPTTCSVTLSVPTDSTAILAVIAEGNDAGTPADTSDDVLSMTALGIQTGILLHDSIGSTFSLQLLDRTSVAQALLSTAAPGGAVFEDVIGVPGISLDGQLLLYPSLGPLATSFLVPTASGPFVNAKLWAVATADNGTDAAWSRVYERGIDPPKSASDSINLTTTAFIDSPSITKTAASTYTLTSDGNLERLEFTTASDEQLNALLFPTQTEFEIPAGVLDDEPASVSVESFDLEVDLTAFDFADLATQSTRIAYSRVDAL
jgi:hypothetical protein